MKREWVDEMIARKRVKLEGRAKFNYNIELVKILIILPVVLIVIDLVSDQPFLLSIFFWISAIISIAHGIYFHRSFLKFEEINLAVDQDQFQEALERTKKDLQWNVFENSPNLVQAVTVSLSFVGKGEWITIIRCSDKVLINSRKKFNMAGLRWKKWNVSILRNHLKDVIENHPYEQKVGLDPQAAKWTPDKIILRSAYYFMLFIFLFSGIFVLESWMSTTAFALLLLHQLSLDIQLVLQAKALEKAG